MKKLNPAGTSLNENLSIETSFDRVNFHDTLPSVRFIKVPYWSSKELAIANIFVSEAERYTI
jgi:hypothetical protein